MEARRVRRWRAVTGLIAVMLLLVLGAWQAVRSDWRPGDQSAVSNGVSMGLTRYQVEDRPTLPAASGTTLEGRKVTLSGFEGSVLVLNVWGSWCGPCRAEAPDLARVAKATRPKGVHFLGIDTRDNPAAAQAFVRRYDIPYPSIDDQNGQVLAQFNGIVPVSAVPSTLVVDPEGRIAARVVGRLDATTLQGLLDDLASRTTPPGKGG